MDEKATRRGFIRKVVIAGTTAVSVSSFVTVVSGDTASGFVELDATATVPTNTSIDITVLEDTDGSGTANRQQTENIPDGTNTIQYDLLKSSTAQGDILWMDISLNTSDVETTPQLDSVTLTLPQISSEETTTEEPAEQPTDPQAINQLWHNPRAFLAAFIIAIAGIGAWSRAITIGAWAGYLTFLYIAFTADGLTMFRNIALVTLVLVFLGFAFKLIRLEFEGES